MEDKKISVIVPVYNAAKYVQTCVDSILNQTYTNLELILVDDGSKDESPALLDEIKSKDPRVVVIHKENGGVSAARNDGIVASTGEYIHFIDSDDWLDKTCYEDMISLMVKEDADVAYFGWSKDNVYKTAFVQSKEGFTGVGGQSEILKYMLSLVGVGGGYVSYGNYVWNKIYKKASLKDCNGNFVLFPTDVNIAEDGLWLVEAAKNFKKGVKKVKVNKPNKTKKIIKKKLKAGKRYFVQVRAFKKITDPATGKTRTVYGKWSNKKKFKVKN